MNPELFFVFDVESAGLHGEGFAFGYVVVDKNGAILEDIGTYFCPFPDCSAENKQWLEENVLPQMESGCFTRQPDPYWLRRAFWERWMKWKSQGAVLVTDCGWPIKANFLSACIADDPENRAWDGPYPLFDLSSVLLAVRENPIETFPRFDDELPAHNPRNDARQSARVMMTAFKKIEAWFQGSRQRPPREGYLGNGNGQGCDPDVAGQ